MSDTLRARAEKLAARPYTVRILLDDSDPSELLYVALNPELDGCMAQGETIEQAEEYLAEFRIDYIEHLLENNLPVPYPTSISSATGGVVTGELSNLKRTTKARGTLGSNSLSNQSDDTKIVFEGSLRSSA